MNTGVLSVIPELASGTTDFTLGGAIVLFTILFFFLLLLRERQESVPAVLQAEGKSRRWINKKAISLESEGEYKGAADLRASLGEFEEAAKLYIQGKAMGRAAEMFLKMGDMERAALAYEKRGLFVMAAQYYQKVKAIRKSASAYLKAGLPLKAAACYEEAKAFDKAADIYQETGHLRKAGELYFRAGDRLKAAQTLEEALREESARLPRGLKPSESRMLSNLGFLIGKFYDHVERKDEAAAAYESGGYLAEAAQIHEEAGRYPLASQLYTQAGQPFKAAVCMERMGRKEEAALTRAKAYSERGQYIDAVSHYELANQPGEAARLYSEMQDYPKAARMFERADDFKQAAEMYIKAEEFDLAAASLDRAREYDRAAKIYKQVGNLSKMAQMLQAAGNYLEAGRAFRELGHVENAIKSLQNVDEDSPDFNETVLLLADIFREKGIPKIALQHYRRVLAGKKVDRANIEHMHNMALCLEASGMLKDALDLYEAIVLVDYHHADAADRVRILQQKVAALATPSTPSGISLTTPSSADATLLGDNSAMASAPSAVRGRRYELIEEIGRGGMGIVYKARDTVLDRIVAYKVLPANLKEHPQAIKNFFREAKSAAALNHTNIVTVHDAGEEDGNYYIAMEYLKGRTVKNILNEKGRLSERTVVLITAQILKALTYAHERKIVHRDIKSSNIMVTYDNIVKLMDFGLAKVIEEVKGAQTVASGTPFYMSPEQTLGKNIDYRTDLYSLGVTMFEMLTGRLPFPDGEAAYHHVHTQPPSPTELVPDIPEIIGDVVMKLMKKKKEERYQSARELLEKLKGISDELSLMSTYGMRRNDDLGLMDIQAPSSSEKTDSEK